MRRSHLEANDQPKHQPLRLLAVLSGCRDVWLRPTDWTPAMSTPSRQRTRRVRPKDCAAEARRYTDLAYGKYEGDVKAQLCMTLDAVDWLRRAVEQLAEKVEAQERADA